MKMYYGYDKYWVLVEKIQAVDMPQILVLRFSNKVKFLLLERTINFGRTNESTYSQILRFPQIKMWKNVSTYNRKIAKKH
jgi:hypothetical protein